jgi:nicotinate phosphoribosyltransferase
VSAPDGRDREPASRAEERTLALLTDLYQLTMAQAYLDAGMRGTAVFDLFVRRLPPTRSYLVACGIDDALERLERLRFGAAAIAELAALGRLSPPFLDSLASFRFTGDVDAVPEGTVVFAGEPLLVVSAPIAEAQIAETLLVNRVHLGTTMASKAARVVTAAAGRRVVDFGLRRMHGADAAVHAARAFHVAGVAATSNVLAARTWGIPAAGTMAHSWIEAHDDELAAFRDFARSFPDTTLLVDTYDTAEGARRVVRLARELGDEFRIAAVRLDSGDLAGLAHAVRRILDEAGLHSVRIFASSSLDEWAIAELLRAGAPIDGFGVGTKMGTSEDAPSLDMVYKLAAYDGCGRVKLSPGKATWPGRKQVFRAERDGEMAGDVVGRADEAIPGRALLEPVMRGGRRLPAARRTLAEARLLAARGMAALPARLRALEPAAPPYPVTPSHALEADRLALRAALEKRASGGA